MLISTANINVSDTSVSVYPDHIEIDDGQTGQKLLAVYLSRVEMRSLASALTQQLADLDSGIARIVTGHNSTHDACADAIGSHLIDWIGDRIPDMAEDDFIDESIELMNIVDEHLPATSGLSLEQLS